MSSEIFINSNQREIRVALMENSLLVELFIEHNAHKGIVGNIYKGKVTKILPGMQVAFVDIGLEKAGFLYVGDIDVIDMLGLEKDAFAPPPPLADEDKDLPFEGKPGRPHIDVKIQDILHEGQEILVQIAKNPLGTKGPRITNYITLPGRHVVYMPTINHISVSRRIEDENERERLKQLISEIGDEGSGYIVRTAGQDALKSDFESDVNFLHHLWENLRKKSEGISAPHLVYEDLNLIFRSIRDLFTNNTERLVIDSKSDYEKCLDFCTTYMPHLSHKIELYKDPMPIFDHYGVELDINRALGRTIWLKSGGYIIIDQTEALIAIDVNTGKYVGHSDPEDTILKTNLEALKEVVYQLRLRNIGGIIIVDFIDMANEENKEIVSNSLKQALKSDRSRTRILKISELGLVEMTRKRVRESLMQTLCDPCDYCEGKGYIKSPSTICYEIIREIQRRGNDNITIKNLQIKVHPIIYDMLFEEESGLLEEIEKQDNLEITFNVNPKLHREKYYIESS
jgi:ribonuclease G